MNTQLFKRLGASGMIISGLALGYSYVSHPHHTPPNVIASSNWIIIHALFAVSLMLGLMGTTALYALSAVRSGWLGFAGFVTLFIGMMMIFGLDYYEIFIAPYLAVHYQQVIIDNGAGEAMGAVAIAFPLAGALTVTGYALLAYAWKDTNVLSQPVAMAMIISSIAFGIGLSPFGGLFAARITAAAFGASLIAIGVQTWRDLKASPSPDAAT